MRKFIIIPIVALGEEPKGVCLEFISDPYFYGGANFKNIINRGLAKAVTATQQVLKQLRHVDCPSSYLYLNTYYLNLTHVKSITLGLALAVFMQKKSCGYKKIIALGKVDPESHIVSVSTHEYFNLQLQAVLKIGKQTQITPLFLPLNISKNIQQSSINRLAELNIQLTPVTTLYEALAILDGSYAYRAISLS